MLLSVFLAFLLALAAALPTLDSLITTCEPSALVQRDQINDYGDSSFIDQTSDSAPWASDCEILARGLRQMGPGT